VKLTPTITASAKQRASNNDNTLASHQIINRRPDRQSQLQLGREKAKTKRARGSTGTMSGSVSMSARQRLRREESPRRVESATNNNRRPSLEFVTRRRLEQCDRETRRPVPHAQRTRRTNCSPPLVKRSRSDAGATKPAIPQYSVSPLSQSPSLSLQWDFESKLISVGHRQRRGC